jgi:hypothetical protein
MKHARMRKCLKSWGIGGLFSTDLMFQNRTGSRAVVRLNPVEVVERDKNDDT